MVCVVYSNFVGPSLTKAITKAESCTACSIPTTCILRPPDVVVVVVGVVNGDVAEDTVKF